MVRAGTGWVPSSGAPLWDTCTCRRLRTPLSKCPCPCPCPCPSPAGTRRSLGLLPLPRLGGRTFASPPEAGSAAALRLAGFSQTTVSARQWGCGCPRGCEGLWQGWASASLSRAPHKLEPAGGTRDFGDGSQFRLSAAMDNVRPLLPLGSATLSVCPALLVRAWVPWSPLS